MPLKAFFLLFSADPLVISSFRRRSNFMVLVLRGASLHHRKSAVAGRRKAPHVGIEDAPGCVTLDAAASDHLVTSIAAYLKEVNSQDTPAVRGNNSLHEEELAQVGRSLA